ncbi:methylated-DNA-protein-cysteine methyltransferase-like protein [Balneicella halophila]|uniref:Methylated-DNA-protein-cysteine methyltransferase-like protein n=1 Tax=Balneicella halophila TaxID=1537566 RepID=A0A7L4UR34_BALHA|nr:MGMT family protein [Balneicella halophila]PVX52238.1 methylated-DNA-protein-cysteine methyltransferase-like protein [Balneicella halophila]
MKISQENIFEIVRKIPKGRVTSYGAIAKYFGTVRSARMVGWIMNTAHGYSPYVPAHRVVNRNGLLTGKAHFGGENTMKELLESEGIVIINDKIVNFEAVFWNPIEELK